MAYKIGIRCAHVQADEEDTSVGSSYDMRGGSPCALPLCWILGLAFPFMFLFGGHVEEWTLNPGESRRIVVSSIFERSVTIERASDSSNGRGSGSELRIYRFDFPCPPLTGPTATERRVPREERMVVEPGGFRRDSFYLNPGSDIDVNLTAHNLTARGSGGGGGGSASVLLFRSRKSFEMWAGDPVEYVDVPLVRSVAYVGRTPARVRWTSRKAEMFYVAYHNDGRHFRATNLTASVRVDASAFDVGHADPVPESSSGCSPRPLDGAAADRCVVETRLWTPDCIIVQAVGTNETDDEDDLIDENAVELKIRRNRRWSLILFMIAVPFLSIAYLSSHVARKCRRRDAPIWLESPWKSPTEETPLKRVLGERASGCPILTV